MCVVLLIRRDNIVYFATLCITSVCRPVCIFMYDIYVIRWFMRITSYRDGRNKQVTIYV